jgi:hypothetical protein
MKRNFSQNKIGLLALYNLCFRSSSTMLYLSLLTLLLKNIGPQSLPWFYTLTNIILLAVNYSIPLSWRSMLSVPFLRIGPIPIISVTILAGTLALTAPSQQLIGISAFIFLVIISNVDELWCLSFANSLGRILTLGESKKWQASIYGAGSLGQFLSGIALKLLLDFMNLGHLLLFNSVLAIASVFIGHKILSLVKASVDGTANDVKTVTEASSEKEPSSESEPVRASSMTDSLSQPLVKLLMIAAMMRIFTKYPVDFIFSGEVNNRFSSPETMASFLGIFSAVSDLGAIILQSCASGWLMQRFPLGKLLAFMPVTMLILSLWSALGGGFMPAVAMQLAMALMARSLFIPGRNILMGSLPADDREHHNRSLFISRTIGTLLSGTMLIFIGSNAPTWTILCFMGFLYGIMCFICLAIDKAYLDTLRNTLGSNTARNSMLSAQFITTDSVEAENSAVLEAITRALSEDREFLMDNRDPLARLGIIDTLRFSDPHEALDFFGKALPREDNPRCARAMAARMSLAALACGADCRRREAQYLNDFIEMMNSSDNPEKNRIIADLLEGSSAAACGSEREAIYISHLNHQNHRVRAAAIGSILKSSLNNHSLENALMNMAEMVHSRNTMDNAAAAAIMGELGIPAFAPSLARLAVVDDEMTANAALRALARTRTPWALSALRNAAFRTPGQRGAWARELFMEASRESASRIGSLLMSMTSSERESLGKILRSIQGESSMELMTKVLGLEDVSLRKILANRLMASNKSEMVILDNILSLDISGKTRIDPKALCEILKSDSDLSQYQWMAMIGSSASLNKSDFITEICLTSQSKKLTPSQTEMALLLISGLAVDPNSILEAITRVQSGDPFEMAIAMEYIEGDLGREIASAVSSLTRTG